MTISRRFFAIALIIGVSTFLLSCTGHQRLYDGPALPPEKIAVIKGSINLLPGTTSLSITSVDGKKLSPHASLVEVLPGKHTLGVEAHLNLAGGRYANGELAIDVLPGKTYELKSTSSGNLVSFAIQQASDNK